MYVMYKSKNKKVLTKCFVHIILFIHLSMVKVAVELSEKVHGRVLDIQVERKKDPKNKKPTAVNKIVAELLEKAVNEENPTK
jgi:hypothetical protein